MATSSSFHYSPHRAISYGAMLNFIIGERGVGKSYAYKVYALTHYIKTKRKFIYLRRTVKEVDEVNKRNGFLKDIVNDDRLKDHNLSYEGYTFYCDDEPCGYLLSLKDEETLKSISFEDVDLIIYEEFLVKQSWKYIKNEPQVLLSFIDTVARLRNNVKIFCLGNALSVVNPYFDYFHLNIPYLKDIQTFKDGTILVEYIKNEPYRAVRRATDFGKLIEGTEYADYSIENNFLNDNNTFITKDFIKSRYFISLIINNHYYGVYFDKEERLYISNAYNKDYKTKITFDISSHNYNTILLKASSFYFKFIESRYQLSMLYFETQQAKADFLQIYTSHH